MSQREKEETEFKVPETLTLLCVNNCGFTGNPATNNMCQNCYKAAGILPHTSRSGHESIKPAPIRSPERPSPTSLVVTDDRTSEPVKSPEPIRQVNRCTSCRKRVGLTGFRCRCGDLFCGEHRYSDRHVCGYDYKGVGREAIARANPVVKAAKIDRV